MRQLIILGSTYLLIYMCVYTSHNYMIKIIQGGAKLTNKEMCTLELTFICKFIGAFFWSNLADRTGGHRGIIATGLIGYAFFLSMFKYAPEPIKPLRLNAFTFIYRAASNFFLSSVFATMDAITLDYLEMTSGTRKYYGILRSCATLGHIFGHGLVAQFSSSGSKTDKITDDYEILIHLTMVTAGITSIFILIFLKNLGLPEKHKNKQKEKFTKKLRRNTAYIKEAINTSVLLLLINVLCQGIHRQSVSIFISSYYEQGGIDTKRMAITFAIRCIPEGCMYFLTPYIEKKIGLYPMFIIGVICGLLRPLVYTFIDLNDYTDRAKVLITYSLELPKGVFSALNGYSGSKISKDLFTDKTRSLGQGLFNGVFSGLAPFTSGIIGYFILDNEHVYKIKNSDIRTLFFVTGIIGVFGLILAIFSLLRQIKQKKIQDKINKNHNEEEEKEEEAKQISI